MARVAASRIWSEVASAALKAVATHSIPASVRMAELYQAPGKIVPS